MLGKEVIVMNVKIKWEGNQGFIGENINGQQVFINPSPKNSEISPPDLLLMSLGSCTGLFIIPAAKALKVEIEDFEISVKGIKSNNPPQLFDKIQIITKFKGNLTMEQATIVLEKSHEKCFILHSLNPNIGIENLIEIV